MAKFLVAFTETMADVEAFAQYVKDSKKISRYWNYIPNVFIVESNLNVRDLAVSFKPFLRVGYLVTEIDNTNTDGQLPSAAWAWFIDEPPKDLSAQMGALFGTDNKHRT